jgi:hypothetical protein
MTVVFYAENLGVCIDDLFHILLVLMTHLQTNGMYVVWRAQISPTK